MPTVEDLLGELSAHPPSEPRPVGEVRSRARWRVRRRRAGLGAGVALVVAAGLAVGAATVQDDPGQDVYVDGGPTTTDAPSTTTGPTTSVVDGVPPESVTVAPNGDLVDGTEVSVTLDEPVTTGQVIVAQCSSEIADVRPGDATDPLSWCVGITYIDAVDLPDFTFAVQRVIHTVDGPVDCAQPDRCVLGVRVGAPSSRDDRHAVLRFAPDQPVVQEAAVTVTGADEPVVDGTVLQLAFTGVETGETIRVDQCTFGPDRETQCSSARGLGTAVQDGPATELAFTAFHDIAVGDGSSDIYRAVWERCEPCSLVVWVGERQDPIAQVPLDMAPTATPIHPTVTIDVDGPVPGGTAVAVRAAGLQPRTEVGVGWCPTARLVGGGDPACVGSSGPDALPTAVAADGTLSVPTFVLPLDAARSVFGDCTRPGECGVGIAAEDAYSVLALAPVTITS